MRASSARLIASGFLLVLFLPLLGRALGIASEQIENRELAERPRITLEGLVDVDFYRRVTAYLVDSHPWREHAISASAWVSLRIFNDSPTSEVHIGRDGWLFLDFALRMPCMHNFPVPPVVEKLEQIGTLLEGSGRSVRSLITPNKHSIYPEYLDADLRRLSACSAARRDELKQLLELNPPPGYIDLFERLEATKRNQSRLLYIPNDSHLTPFGAAVQSAAIVESLGAGLWEAEALTRSKEQRHTGDLTRLLGLPSTVPTELFTVRRQGVRVTTLNPVALPGGPPLRRSRALSDGPPLIQERTLFIHDSQLNGSMAALRQYFADATFLNINTFTPAVALPLFRNSEVVVLQSTERGVYYRIPLRVASPELLEGLERLPSAGKAGQSEPASR